MVQAALGTVGAALGGLGSAFSNQTRQISNQRGGRVDTTTGVIAASKDAKVAKQAADNASQERWLYFLTQPEFLSLAVLIAGLYASNRITFSKDNSTQNELMQSLAMAGAVLISLGYAGVGDLTTSSIAATAGIGNMVTGSLGDLFSQKSSNWGVDLLHLLAAGSNPIGFLLGQTP